MARTPATLPAGARNNLRGAASGNRTIPFVAILGAARTRITSPACVRAALACCGTRSDDLMETPRVPYATRRSAAPVTRCPWTPYSSQASSPEAPVRLGSCVRALPQLHQQGAQLRAWHSLATAPEAHDAIAKPGQTLQRTPVQLHGALPLCCFGVPCGDRLLPLLARW